MQVCDASAIAGSTRNRKIGELLLWFVRLDACGCQVPNGITKSFPGGLDVWAFMYCDGVDENLQRKDKEKGYIENIYIYFVSI